MDFSRASGAARITRCTSSASYMQRDNEEEERQLGILVLISLAAAAAATAYSGALGLPGALVHAGEIAVTFVVFAFLFDAVYNVLLDASIHVNEGLPCPIGLPCRSAHTCVNSAPKRNWRIRLEMQRLPLSGSEGHG